MLLQNKPIGHRTPDIVHFEACNSRIVDKFMPYAMASIFIARGFYQRVLLSVVHITFDKGVDKGSGSDGHDHYYWNVYGYAAGAGRPAGLSFRYYTGKKINRYCTAVADCLQYSVVISLFILPNFFK
jgi:hypothetical protein